MTRLLQNVGVCVAAFLVILGAQPAIAQPTGYEWVTDAYGVRLGINYRKEGANLLGELGIHTSSRLFVFLECRGHRVLYGERYMERRGTNCNGSDAFWPSGVIETLTALASAAGSSAGVSVAPSVRVRLTGSPSNCGMCQEKPYVDFELPSGVEVISPEGLRELGLTDPNVSNNLPLDELLLPSDGTQFIWSTPDFTADDSTRIDAVHDSILYGGDDMYDGNSGRLEGTLGVDPGSFGGLEGSAGGFGEGSSGSGGSGGAGGGFGG